ncbi:hypothetical protein F5B19DRAFT_179085 [Rostrohypoxylon terebratum]|nr:hypothetical protein F5B19DRAFT_179085 [Rostrohypoxylon terebratum]
MSPDEYGNWQESFLDEPLLKRGWVVQERILSKRALYFGSEQVFWECYEITRCETHQKTLQSLNERSTIEVGHVWKGLTGHDRYASTWKNDTQQLFEDWYYLVEMYTSCELTYSRDKLVAMSGIVKDMRQHLVRLKCESTRYLAGIWQQELPQALLWDPEGGEHYRRPEIYRAPSWSWASIDGVIGYRSSFLYSTDGLEILSSVIGAWVTPVNRGDDTGEVSDGMITLAGILIIANLGPLPESNGCITERAIIDLRDYEDDTLLCETKTMSKTYWATVTFDTQDDNFDQIFCLPIMKKVFHCEGRFSRHIIEGLVVTRVDDGNYRRVGHFTITTETEDEYRSLLKNASRGHIDII